MFISPRQLDIIEISPKVACELNAMWHRTLPVLPYTNVIRNRRWVCYGAYYDNLPRAVLIYSSPVTRLWNTLPILELRRFAISAGCPHNTATYLLSRTTRMIRSKFPDLEVIISYQDTEEHVGTIYKAGNWSLRVKKSYKPKWNVSRDRNSIKAKKPKNMWYLTLKRNSRLAMEIGNGIKVSWR